jgi:8-oxo-dGTP pyrophosphatase MutT (NUDIX family)
MRSAQVEHGQTWSIPGGGDDDPEKTAKESDPRMRTPGSSSCDFVAFLNPLSVSNNCLPPRPVGRIVAIRELMEEAGGGDAPFAGTQRSRVVLPSVHHPIHGHELLHERTLGSFYLPPGLTRVFRHPQYCPHFSKGIFVYLLGQLDVEYGCDSPWMPRAREKHRWEIDEHAAGTHYGYAWVDCRRLFDSDYPVAVSDRPFCPWIGHALRHRQDELRLVLAQLCALHNTPAPVWGVAAPVAVAPLVSNLEVCNLSMYV